MSERLSYIEELKTEKDIFQFHSMDIIYMSDGLQKMMMSQQTKGENVL